jgi:hypothetical protein
MPRTRSTFDLLSKTIRGETVAIGDPQKATVLAKLVFLECNISINCSAPGLVVDQCIFQDCTIGAKKAQSDHQFFTSTFERCKFTGEFFGCEFGFRNDVHGRIRGAIVDCDLTEATLDLVSFNNCQLDTLKLPRWPHFTITDPHTTAKRIPNPLGCEELEILKDTCLSQTAITKGITCYAPYFLEETQYSEAQLRRLLSGVAGIVI